MKKLLLLSVFALTVFAAQAQKGSGVVLPLAVGDTIKNTGTVSKFITLSGGYDGTSVQVVLSKISGTGAGTVQLQGSVDGVNYVNLGSAFTITDVTTQTQIFYVGNPLPYKIKVLCTGSGTEAVQVRVWYRTPVFQTN
jgi:hypothetical protein